MASVRLNRFLYPRKWIGLSDEEVTRLRAVVDMTLEDFWDNNDINDEGDRKAVAALYSIKEALDSLA